MSYDVDVVVDARAELGEGPVWDERIDRVVWVDILGRAIHQTDPDTGDTESIPVPLDVGAVVPRADGGYLAALQDGFWVVGDGLTRRVVEVDGGEGLRFNDGKCDPGGRFWAGTMAYSESRGSGSLYRYDGEVSLQVADVTVSNGLAWSHDGTTMYYIDTPTRRIDAFTFDPDTGAIEDRRPFIHVPDTAGYPDGMTIDAEGALWVALWDGGALHRYVDGELARIVPMPVSRPTSCAFGGPAYDRLYVTSAWTRLSETDRADQPLAGALFVVDTEVGGSRPDIFGTG